MFPKVLLSFPFGDTRAPKLCAEIQKIPQRHPNSLPLDGVRIGVLRTLLVGTPSFILPRRGGEKTFSDSQEN
jgi:hypothetical protein